MANEVEESFVPETEDDDDEKMDGKEATTSIVAEKTSRSGAPNIATHADDAAPEQRFLNDQWIARYEHPRRYVRFHDEVWCPIAEDEEEFIEQLWMEQEAAEIQVVDGVKMKWNAEKNEWLPLQENDDDDFIAQYQANYGVQHTSDWEKLDKEIKSKKEEKIHEAEEKKKKRKGAPVEEQQGWVDISDKVHAVYVSNLPLDITEEEFTHLMAKAGIIQSDMRTGKPKIKLYRDDEGNVKGDGRCCYIKKESLDLALTILDDLTIREKKISVEIAKFEQKGDYDPTKKRKKQTAAMKKRYMERQNKLFDWEPEKPRNFRPISDCTVIFKNLFTLDMMMKNPALVLDLKEEVEKTCTRFGTVKKVVVFDNNSEGVVSVAFTNTEESDTAVKMLNGVLIDGRKIEAQLWDGRTNYKVAETEEQRQARLDEWKKMLGGDEE